MKMESLPDDLIFKIMQHLLLKSLVRCVSVCKRWKSIICARDFKTRYLQRSLQMLSMPRDTAPNSLFRSIFIGEIRYIVSTPVRGWICVQSSTEFMLYNPITNDGLHLPVLVGGRRFLDRCIFGYDEATSVFKVLGFIDSSFEVYTVRSGGEGSWRPIACEHPHNSITNPLCKGGVLYYAAITLPDFAPIIMSFDLNSETFDYNQLPEGFIVNNVATMVNYNGKVAMVYDSATQLQNTGGFQICVRNEDSGQWELEHVVISDWKTSIWSGFLFSFVGTIGSGELVFTAVAESLAAKSFAEWEYVLYYEPGSSELRGPFLLKGANKGAYHYVRACLNHFECLFRST